MNSFEKEQTVEPVAEVLLIDRLKRIKELTRQAGVPQKADLSSVIDVELPNGLVHNVVVLKQKAKTEVYNNRDIASAKRIEMIDLINSIVIVPDEKLADIHKNEMNLTPFVRRFLPQSEWSKYIPG